MNNPYHLLEGILAAIENKLKDGINVDMIADEFDVSTRHMQRLFKLAFFQSIGLYIRSRKLAASIDDLLNSKLSLFDIALDYGFEYEQSYIRSFKREYGITPGDLRKSGKTLKITPPLNLFNAQKKSDGIMFGPEIVIVPQFFLIGKQYQIPFEESVKTAPNAAKRFWENERRLINKAVNLDVYIGFTHNINHEKKYSEYLTAVQVRDLSDIPQGLSGATFNTSMCARFRYIGQHHYYDLNREIASKMYSAIQKYINDENSKYILSLNKIYFERIDIKQHDGNYCQMEWFTPITEKSS